MAGGLAEVAWCSVARGFSKITGTIWGVPIIRIIVFCRFLGFPLFGKLPCAESLCPWQPF